MVLPYFRRTPPKFQDNQKMVYATPAGHLLLVIAFSLPKPFTIFTNPFALTCGLTAILFFVIIKLNNWQSPHFNLLLIFVYILIVFGELILFGIPMLLFHPIKPLALVKAFYYK